MKLTIINPHHKHEYAVQWVEAHTPAGFLVIQPEHAPMIFSLVAGSDFTFMLDTHEKKVISLTRPGFMEITRNSVLALVGE